MNSEFTLKLTPALTIVILTLGLASAQRYNGFMGLISRACIRDRYFCRMHYSCCSGYCRDNTCGGGCRVNWERCYRHRECCSDYCKDDWCRP
ncbi:unnamed protein product [Allacma fusca]|uniref:Uncharacterized protein n=1 Tax=Allacma fusca TaxID=39272 RepID=A0A8J2KXM5_9HEXA|nr:unnamed protein product [Allacma fusca]